MNTSSHNRLRSIVDRILRLKEQQDEIGADVREVYAEAKAEGFDKTALGRLVSHIRKREKNPEKVEEGDAIFDLYLSTYDGTVLAHVHTHAREEGPQQESEKPAAVRSDAPLSASDAIPSIILPKPFEEPDLPAHLDRRAS